MKHIVIPALALCLSTAALAPISAVSATAAEIPETQNQEYSVVNAENDIQPRLLTRLTINLRASETPGYIEGVAYNSFTLFSSTVYVRLYLYSSYTPETNISNMKLEKMVVTADLDMGQELVVKVSNNGEQKYWRAFMQFCINGGDMQSHESETCCYDADGTLIYIIPEE